MAVFNIGPAKRQKVWDELREYAHLRFWFRDLPGVPGFVKPFWRGSMSFGGLLEWAIGADPGELDTYVVTPLPDDLS